jgi:hypothetical protein
MGRSLSFDLTEMHDNISYWRCFTDRSGLLAMPDVFITNPRTTPDGFHKNVPHLTFHPNRDGSSTIECHAKLFKNGKINYCPENWELTQSDDVYMATDAHYQCSEDLCPAMDTTLYILNFFAQPIAKPVSTPTTTVSAQTTTVSAQTSTVSAPTTAQDNSSSLTKVGEKRKANSGWVPITYPPKRGGGSGTPDHAIYSDSSDSDSDDSTIFDDHTDDSTVTVEEYPVQREVQTFSHRVEIKAFFRALLASDTFPGFDFNEDEDTTDYSDQLYIRKEGNQTVIYFNIENPPSQRGGDRSVFQFAGIAVGLAMTVACSIIAAFQR